MVFWGIVVVVLIVVPVGSLGEVLLLLWMQFLKIECRFIVVVIFLEKLPRFYPLCL